MRFSLPIITFVGLINLAEFNVWSAGAVAIWIFYLVNFLSKINSTIAFREYIVLMYGLNYLFSAAIQYEITQDIAYYKMRMTPETYFPLAIPAMLALHLGLYTFKTKIFEQKFSLSAIDLKINEVVLRKWLIAGLALTFIRSFLPGDLSFIAYLLSGIKYVAAFGLFIIDRKKFKGYLYLLVGIELFTALREGMFHDLVIWVLFFSMVWMYLTKPSASVKFSLITIGIIALFTLQSVKGAYRKSLSTGEGGLSALTSTVSNEEKDGGVFNIENLALSLTRSNQGWIFSSSANLMDQRKNFQQMNIIKMYAEAAFLPRFLAPDKMNAGDKLIFNLFSGARISKNESTSMALGLFADGYIAFGKWGLIFFAFFFGLIISLTFKLIENWADISPFFALIAFPLLNYAVRADCETQTWMGHIVKGVFVFSILIYFTKQSFLRLQKLDLAKTDPALNSAAVSII